MSGDGKYFHVGHFFLERMKQRDPESICQIDAGTGEEETVRSLLTRTVRLARSLQSVGLQPGDVLALAAGNHLDSRVPYYAAMLVGLPVAGVDPHFKYYEVKSFLNLTKPKIVFCQQEQRELYLRVAEDLAIDLKIITFDGDDNMVTFIEMNDDNQNIDGYEPVQFDPDSVYAWLVSTSGSTGIPKVASFKHKGLIDCVTNWMAIMGLPDTPETFRLNKRVLTVSPTQWITSYVVCLGVPLLGGTVVQTSASSVEHVIATINKYKTTAFVSSPSLIASILKHEKQCDLTCFDLIATGGSKVHKDIFIGLRSRMRNDAKLIEMYGQSETGTIVCVPVRDTPIGSCGQVQQIFSAKIDAGTGEEETVRSLLTRTVRLARSLQSVGLQPGDVLALAAGNHLDSRVPYYAAMLVGLPVAGVDPHFKYYEVKSFLNLTKPKIVFCQQEQRELYLRVAEDLAIDLKIITFDGDDNMVTFIEMNDDNQNIDGYEPVQFDPDSVYAWLVSTSGSTGIPKVASFKHKGLIDCVTNWMAIMGLPDTPETFRLNKRVLTVSPTQWITSYVVCLGVPLLGGTVVQTSASSVEHVIATINKYKTTAFVSSPSLIASILKHEKQCDLTCFDLIATGGSKVHKDIFIGLRSRMRNDAKLIEMYGQSETGTIVCVPVRDTPIGSCGQVQQIFSAKLVDPHNGADIKESHKTGELWVKGPYFDGYYKNPNETAKCFTEDGWLKTGDLFYKDEEENFYFVERLKMLIKYRNFAITPPELEEVILAHQGVLEVAVTSVPHETDSQHPVACIVRQPGATVTAQEIKDLIANNLSDSKRLRGGVVFTDRLPKTSTGKINRKKIEEIALNSSRE